MIVSMSVSHFVKICQGLTILPNLSVGVSLILGHGAVTFINRKLMYFNKLSIPSQIISCGCHVEIV